MISGLTIKFYTTMKEMNDKIQAGQGLWIFNDK